MTTDRVASPSCRCATPLRSENRGLSLTVLSLTVLSGEIEQADIVRLLRAVGLEDPLIERISGREQRERQVGDRELFVPERAG